MDPFVRRLVERLFAPDRPMSRNRHFHTFESPEGRRALRVSKRLQALQRDLARSRGNGAPAEVTTSTNEAGDVVVRIHLVGLKGTRTTLLERDEFELLLKLPGVREALSVAPGDAEAP